MLFDVLGLNTPDRTYGAVVRAALNSSSSWTVLADFCETAMRKKEQAECKRRVLERPRLLPLRILMAEQRKHVNRMHS